MTACSAPAMGLVDPPLRVYDGLHCEPRASYAMWYETIRVGPGIKGRSTVATVTTPSPCWSVVL